jgi:calcium-dependent protein kinase
MLASVSSQARKEFEILRRLDHPNIIRIHELIESQYHFYIVSEFCDGGELYSELLKYRRFDEAKAA